MLKRIRMRSFNIMLWIAKFSVKEKFSIFDILLFISVVAYVTKSSDFGLFNVFVLIAIALIAAIVNVIVDTVEYLKDE